ncbi:UbiA family prenyltransferase [Thalassovita mangrovi]|uniref:UbiA family prenyltransferase n=1 Tax=Thalassovita mangrovi TaxID=2692236 RepID=A0A6L8LPA7_9RHOB|nr:UbiA family prenyltransferase [Thalassovita mangrovi]MYM56420.1 UbiA family prenyltransferase [Thalassovita mangrovi]
MPDSVNPHSERADIPLFVDMDGTLVRTDVAQELLVRAFKSPAALWAVASGGASTGVSGMKRALSDHMEFHADILPYNPDVLDYVEKARGAGRRVFLATAADSKVARAVADHTGLFDDVIATEPGHNMKGATKLAAIRDAAGPGGFEYLGDSSADLPIWHEARLRGFAAIPPGARDLAADGTATLMPGDPASFWRALFRAMRPHQWVKNILVFVPLFFAHMYFDALSVTRAALAFVAFSACASAVYLINDMLDVEADRSHASKCKRPFAAGELTPKPGVAAALILMLAGLAVGFGTVGWQFGLVLLLYLGLTQAYSLWLKVYSTIDVVVLSLLYTLRIVAGAAAIQVVPSPWILTFSLFFFLSLAYMKRYIELSRAKSEGRLPSRNYYTGDVIVVQIFGIANAALSLMTMAEYISNEQAQGRYQSPGVLWLMLPVMMFWTYRSWMWANRDQIGDDPVVFAIKDRISRFCGLILVGIVLAAYAINLDWMLP